MDVSHILKQFFSGNRYAARAAANENGALLIDTLFAIALYSVLALNLSLTGALMIKTRNRSVYNSVAMQLAMEKMEELSALNPELLTNDTDESETIAVGQRHFIRQVDITVLPEGPREAEVTVSAENEDIDVSVSLNSSFALWGTR